MLTVLILAAGYGRRMGPFSRMVNKGLIPYDNKPLISHIMEKFDRGTKFVVACGHMGQQVKDYVGAVHTDKQVVYVDIPDYAEGSTGPATTIQLCAEHINGAFIWLSCDTLFDFDYKNKLDHNWIGVHPVNNDIAQDYCWVRRDGETITEIKNKEPSNQAVDAFIGLMYCKDMQYVKWVELSTGLKEVSFPKPNELFYHDNHKIIKFTTDQTLAEKKVDRAGLNPAVMPNGIKRSGQFLVYNFVEGDIIYSQLTPELLDKLLVWANKDLWKRKWFPNTEDICRNFYFDKTMDRLAQFRVKYSDWSEPSTVNGVAVKSIDEYLKMIDWDSLCRNTQWAFIHGDFQFENVIYNSVSDKFTCIDWRTDFGGDSYGDLYYDLAKMAGGMLLDYQAVKANKLEYAESNDNVTINDCFIPNGLAYVNQLAEFCTASGLDWTKVQLLWCIIYLNMSPLHDAPFDKYLFALAQLQFSRYFQK